MRETIICAPRAGGAERLRSLAGSGRNTLGVRTVGSVELARHGVMDVLCKKDGRWHIIDHKTNADPSDPEEKHREQRKACVAAFREMSGEEADARVYHPEV